MSVAESGMKINAMLPYFGGKRTLSPEIIREAGDHFGWWEPFCGGVSIILQKERCRQETLNDLHGDVINLGIVIASPRWVEFYQDAVLTTYNEGIFDACKSAMADKEFKPAEDPDSVTDKHIRRAWSYLCLSWMGRNGAAGTARINYQFTMRYTSNGGDSATRWRGVVDSIPWWHERLHGVVFSRRDGIKLAENIDDAPGTIIYCDPPYIEEGDAYEHSFSSDGGMFGGDDHDRLAEALRAKKKARCIVSYYDHPRLALLYPGWTVRKFTMKKSLAAQNKRGVNKTEAPEVLLINGPSFAEVSPCPT